MISEPIAITKQKRKKRKRGNTDLGSADDEDDEGVVTIQYER
jgi:hypothetical protein